MTHHLWHHVRVVPDFPKAGIEFYDISPLLHQHNQALISALVAAVPSDLLASVDALVAVESRGFILASLLAAHLNKGLILVRKAGKLPPPVHRQSYGLEYGNDTLEISAELEPANVLIIDDVLATGGTLTATHQLCQKANLNALGALVLLDLPALHGDLTLPYWTVFHR
ncbi:adenine phosphoribosyltransferase [Moraxella marmotae]|uniref:adenine phosphoribosyltransferase n=1 Tax=Moraxella marmotae TaxID=3344520 RepID=UPI0035D426A1